MIRRVNIFLFCLFILGFVNLSAPAWGQPGDPVPDDIYWDVGFGRPAVTYPGNIVRDIVEYNGTIIFGGYFYDRVGDVDAQNIIAWDGVTYQTLDTGVGFWVYGITIYENKLYAYGMQDIAVWDGLSWEIVDTSYFYDIGALEVYNDTLYAGGRDSAYNFVLVKWNGSGWENSGQDFNGMITALRTIDSQLVVGGEFTSINDTVRQKIAYWDGSNWYDNISTLGYTPIKIFPYNNSLAALCESSTRNIVVTLDDVGQWHYLPDYRLLDDITDMTVYNNQITVVYEFNDTTGSAVVTYDGANWQEIGTHCRARETRLTVINNKLVIAGSVAPNNIEYYRFAVEWDGDSWDLISELGTSNAVFEILPYNDSSLFIGGVFDYGGGVGAYALGGFYDNQWTSYGSGNVYNLTLLKQVGGIVYAGGYFDSIAGIPSNSLVSFNGTEWVDEGLADFRQVNDIAEYNDKTILSVGGLTNSSSPEPHLLEKNTNQWDSFGISANRSISSIIEYKSNLIIAGQFDSLNGMPFHNIASWDGNNLNSIPGFPLDSVLSIWNLQVIRDSLYMIAVFYEPPSNYYRDVLMWDGSTWSFMLGQSEWDENRNVYDYCLHNNHIYVGGRFDSLKNTEVNNIARWDGPEFYPLGSGVDTNSYNYEYGLVVLKMTSFQNNLYVGGSFDFAGTHRAANFARWTKGVATDIEEPVESTILPEQFILYQNYPNPFNPSTDISFELPRKNHVTIEIYNITGQKVTTLLNKEMIPGVYTVSFNGSEYASGLYFYKLSVGEYESTRKMILLK